MNRTHFGLTAFFVTICLSSCGPMPKVDLANAKIVLENSTSASPANLVSPSGSSGDIDEDGKKFPAYPATTFATKLVRILLIEDLQQDGLTSKGVVGHLWINPKCGATSDQDGAAAMANDGTCDTTKIDTFVDWTRPSSEINAELNEQSLVVPSSTYKFVRMQICDSSTSETNAKIASKSSGLEEIVEMRTRNCDLATSPLIPALTLAKEESVTITLKYDLSKALVDYSSGMESGTFSLSDFSSKACAKSENGIGVRCIHELEATPTAAK